ncbi:unnamed protein product [Schistosoma margrebowiei]|uniref:Uncharacterized protein n=1 Tax=Schistosoma margrebowiei TaxID=48269 RepID=A0A183LXL0_9TREM|nr:unnamed protein product [Schistosoma margrebowiei]
MSKVELVALSSLGIVFSDFSSSRIKKSSTSDIHIATVDGVDEGESVCLSVDDSSNVESSSSCSVSLSESSCFSDSDFL